VSRTLRALVIAGLLALLAGCGDDVVDPRIEAILPDRGAPGTVVDVVGERFAGVERQVSFGGVAAVVDSWQDQRARVRVPAGPTGLTVVVVTIDGRPSNPVDFLVE
jgi:hypothetical protein